MKNMSWIPVAGLLLFSAGCSLPPTVLAPVGPNPFVGRSQDSTGQLQVFSRPAAERDDQDEGGDGTPLWHHYSDYNIYNLNGTLLQKVSNSTGHYASGPTPVSLPAGRYWVKAQARGYFWVKLPVVIEPGQTTTVHLDGNWNPPADAPKSDVVTAPDGKPVGWRPGSTGKSS
jgi:hypothetical protein